MNMDEKNLAVTETFVNDEKGSNEVGVKDDIGLDMIKRQLGALLVEEEAFVEALEQGEKSYENYQKQWDIDKRLFELQLEHFGLEEKNYTHKLHSVPEYWDLEKTKFEYKVKQETFSAEQRLKQYEEEQTNALKRLNLIREEIPKKVVMIEEAEGSVDLDVIKREFK